MFKHILFPTDTSDVSNSGFSTAVDLAKKYDAKVTLLNIHEEFMDENEMQYLRVSAEHYREMMDNKAKASREKMEKIVEDANAGDFCEIVLREGNPRNKIVELAKDLDADLIVMTSNGRSNLKEALIGSVAEHVVRVSTLPVLVVKIHP